MKSNFLVFYFIIYVDFIKREEQENNDRLFAERMSSEREMN